jgi:ankyrin repeat protein
LAAKFKKKEIAAILLEAGGDVNQKDNDGKTPLDYAKSTGDSDLLNLFTKK